METVYLYIRVSTDEQKRKGYSLPEQEDRLLKYCDYNHIKVKCICREDFPTGRSLRFVPQISKRTVAKQT